MTWAEVWKTAAHKYRTLHEFESRHIKWLFVERSRWMRLNKEKLAKIKDLQQVVNSLDHERARLVRESWRAVDRVSLLEQENGAMAVDIDYLRKQKGTLERALERAIARPEINVPPKKT